MNHNQGPNNNVYAEPPHKPSDSQQILNGKHISQESQINPQHIYLQQNQQVPNPQIPGGQPMPMNQPQMYQQQPMMGQPPMYQQQPMMGQPPLYQQQPMMGSPQMYPQPMYQQNPQMYQSQSPILGQPMMMQSMFGQQMIQQQAQQGMMMMPVDPNFFGGMNCYYITNPMQELGNAKMASIKQRFEPWEIISGCETPNQYYVFVKDQEGRQKYLFKAKEESTCCCRYFCAGSAREFTLNIRTVAPNPGKVEKKEDFAVFERPFKCTCCCLARPVLTGKLSKDKNDPSKPALGKIIEEFRCCDPCIKTYDSKNQPRWFITCDCCQCGYCCSNSMCGMCSEVDFEVYPASGKTEGKPPGTIRKKFKGLQSMIGDADFFDLYFPEAATPEERFMLVTAVIMLDYMKYEDKDNDQAGGGYGRHHRHGFY